MAEPQQDMRLQGTFGPAAATGPGHETSDVRIGGIVIFTVGLVGLTVVVLLGLGGLMGWFDRRQERKDEVRPARYQVQAGQYPGPNLQDNPVADVVRMRRENKEALDTYGWADRDARVARIPIDRAIDILAARGLPARDPAEPPQVKGLDASKKDGAAPTKKEDAPAADQPEKGKVAPAKDSDRDKN